VPGVVVVGNVSDRGLVGNGAGTAFLLLLYVYHCIYLDAVSTYKLLAFWYNFQYYIVCDKTRNGSTHIGFQPAVT
jgi:hypothetical protein